MYISGYKLYGMLVLVKRVHYNDVIMSPLASQLTSLTIAYSSIY